MAKRLPRPLQCFKMTDFFQTAVDDFADGHFRFRSIEEVDLKMPDDKYGIDWLPEKGLMVHTYLYDSHRDRNGTWHGREFDILVFEYKLKPWHNHYHAEGAIAGANGADYMFANTINAFIEWIDLKGGRLCEPRVKKFVDFPDSEELSFDHPDQQAPMSPVFSLADLSSDPGDELPF